MTLLTNNSVQYIPFAFVIRFLFGKRIKIEGEKITWSSRVLETKNGCIFTKIRTQIGKKMKVVQK